MKMTNELEGELPAVDPEPLEPAVITISCGTDDHILEKKVTALAAQGLAIHPDANDESIFVITHVACGRKVCDARTQTAARIILTRLLRLSVRWTNLVLWESETEARELKRQISDLWR